MRVGIGFDVHAFTKDRPLILGGIQIPSKVGGLEGHSDADVLTHSLIDALLGALCLGTIGSFFPDTDPQYKDISSLVLLKKVYTIVQEKGFKLGNCDCSLVMQAPKLLPFIDQIQCSLADCMGVDSSLVSCKATTSEKLGFEGRSEGISCHCVVLLRAL